ncbi:unnamed protein product [Ilex paraguariensis]|uniref:Uncharacterized protein n=1 Tax=Ilex paraguariensis TaxID=185542 RepID=A0ABC8QVJ6_9AQUA
MVLDLELRLSSIHVPSDCECIDDDVVICSPRSFAEAREKSRRNHGPIEVFNVETESQRGFSARLSTVGNRARRTPAKQRTAAGNFSILEGHKTTKSVNVAMREELPFLCLSPRHPLSTAQFA